MSREIKRLFIYGFPSLYGGAGTELHHQIILWLTMGMEIHIIPTSDYFMDEALYDEMITRGVYIHAPHDWNVLEAGDPVIGFCSNDFLSRLSEIHAKTKRTIFVNCMTWLFEKEKEAMKEGLIAMFLYQNEDVLEKNKPILQALNSDPNIQFMTFKPYFHNDSFPFIETRDDSFFGCGRISRHDADKFSKYTLHIYEYFVAPQMKKGLFLGFNEKSEAKIGKPYSWIQVAKNQNEVSQQEFYKHCRIILQATDTTENWPRIGFEAMASGSVLVVDRRGGWNQMVKHGETGWLCDSPRDFIYYASKMAYEPHLRDDMAYAAYERGLELGSLQSSRASWEEVFERIAQLQE